MSETSIGLTTSETHQPTTGLRWPPRLRTKPASDYMLAKHGITLSPATLNKLRVVGGGPAFQYDGRFPVYQPHILDEYACKRLGRLRKSTSDEDQSDDEIAA
jgi:hypothetical protein